LAIRGSRPRNRTPIRRLDELRAGDCATVFEEHASGADRSRPVLARLLHEIHPGETLVVVRLDRLARSVSHLLAVIELRIGALFLSRDPRIANQTAWRGGGFRRFCQQELPSDEELLQINKTSVNGRLQELPKDLGHYE
jgi:Resolvase, N terminal domain